MRAIFLIVPLLFAGCAAEERTSVAPWDFPDGPIPHREEGSTSLPDPKSLTKAKDYEATTPSGVTVTLESIARKLPPSSDPPAPGSTPIWTPNGAPYVFPEPWVRNQGGGMSELEDKGGRILDFKVIGPAGEASITGYVPKTAIRKAKRPEFNGWDLPRTIFLSTQWDGDHVATVAVEDRSSDRYMFAIATGDWRQVASVPIHASDKDNRTLASGPWGTLRREAPPQEPVTIDASKRVMHVPRYVVDPPSEPPTHALRVRLVDAKGNPGYLGRSLGRIHRTPPAVRAVVESRPYEWVEFTGVHYDPDPKLWGPAHWGEEGEGAVAKAQNTSLEGFIRPQPVPKIQGWVAANFYAPDGKEWRGYPRPELLRARFSGGMTYDDLLIAVLQLDPQRVSEANPAQVSVGRAMSDDPLGPWKQTTARRPLFQHPISRSSGEDLVRFEIRYTNDSWKKVGEFQPPMLLYPTVAPEDLEKYRLGQVYKTLFSVHLRSYGQVDYGFVDRNERSQLVEGLVRWREKDTEARLIARLNDGRRVPLDHTSVGVGQNYTSRSYDFEQTADSEPVYDTSRHGAGPKVKIRLVDVRAFEIEVREYGEPVVLTARLPKIASDVKQH